MANARFTVSIDPGLKEQLDQFAENQGLDRSAALETILEKHFSREREAPKPVPTPVPQPQVPGPVPAPAPVNPAPAPQPGHLTREIESLKDRIQDLERSTLLIRQYSSLTYPVLEGLYNRNLAHHVYLYGTYLDLVQFPKPPWWDDKKGPLSK